MNETPKETMLEGFYCKTCGKRHDELPMEFGTNAPLTYYSIPEE